MDNINPTQAIICFSTVVGLLFILYKQTNITRHVIYAIRFCSLVILKYVGLALLCISRISSKQGGYTVTIEGRISTRSGDYYYVFADLCDSIIHRGVNPFGHDYVPGEGVTETITIVAPEQIQGNDGPANNNQEQGEEDRDYQIHI